MTEGSSSTQDAFTSKIQECLRLVSKGVKDTKLLPTGPARRTFTTCYPLYNTDMKKCSDSVLEVMTKLLKKENIKIDITNMVNEDKAELVSDVVTNILERVRPNLRLLKDEENTVHTPLIGSPIIANTPTASWNRFSSSPASIERPMTSKVSTKPQHEFSEIIDNSISPFKPRLTSKPNAIKPLAVYIERSETGDEHYCHPYLHELQTFKTPERQLCKTEPTAPSQNNSYTFISDDEQLQELVKTLKEETEIAVDLEHHNFRSYQGFTCLMQLSTRKDDYIIDTLKLRSSLQILNEVFTDPEIVKVFHGAYCDIQWLQKDFGLYVVNMFDTQIAASKLNFPRLGLAYLLQKYCDFESNKRYQMFDWRTRPLPDAALAYAKSDTHYLLYIYDVLKNELLEEGTVDLLNDVYSRATDLCKRKYEKFNPDKGHLKLYQDSKQTFDNRQMYALEHLYNWRDDIARKEDESTGYVLPNHMLLKIAEILPREMQGILACCFPVPLLVKKHSAQLHKIVLNARSQSVSTPVSKRSSIITPNNVRTQTKLRYLHDLSHTEFRDNLPTLIDGTDTVEGLAPNEMLTPQITVFENRQIRSKGTELTEKAELSAILKYVSPYERYKQTLTFIISEMEKEDLLREKAVKRKSSDEDDSIIRFTKKVKFSEDVDSKLNIKIESDPDTTADNLEDSTCSENLVKPDFTKEVQNLKKQITKEIENLKSGGKKIKQEKLDTDQVASTSSSVLNPEADNSSSDFNKHEMKSDSINANMPDGNGSWSNRRRGQANHRGRVEGRNKNHNFQSFNYSNVNYGDRFRTGGFTNTKRLLNQKVTFGNNKKVKQRQNFRRKS